MNWTELQPVGNAARDWRSVSSDSDGSHLITCCSGIGGRIYTSANSGVTWAERRPAGDVDRDWSTVASGADGQNLLATCSGVGGRVYSSSDGGGSWTELRPAGDADYEWKAAAMDADGSHLIVGVNGGRLYLSVNSGVDWTEIQPDVGGDPDKNWRSAAMDATGLNMIVSSYTNVWSETPYQGRVFTSDDSGSNWIQVYPAAPGVFQYWTAVASDVDGTHLMAGSYYDPDTLFGHLYTSVSGIWTERAPAGAGRYWESAALSSDGSRMIVGPWYSPLYTSIDGGANWSPEFPAGGPTEIRIWMGVASNYNGTRMLACCMTEWNIAGRLYLGTSAPAVVNGCRYHGF